MVGAEGRGGGMGGKGWWVRREGVVGEEGRGGGKGWWVRRMDNITSL